MDQSLADLVHPVLTQGLAIKSRVAAGQAVELLATQAMFRDLLKVNDSSFGGAEFRGDTQRSGTLPVPGMRSMDTSLLPEQFLGIRYALVCWLDELFTDEAPWGRKWNESKLEVELYGSNDRAWKFWSQARLAQARPATDCLEVFYLCFMLGFRGDLRDRPEELHKWVASAKHRLGRVTDMHWPLATEIEPATAVPPLRGRLRLRRMIAVSCVVLLFAIPALSFLAVHHLSQ
jgi:type VI secretion system protein ImpK